MAASTSAPSTTCCTVSGSRSNRSMKFFLMGALAGLMAFSSAGAQTADPEETIHALRDRLAAERKLLMDWAGLNRYGSEDTEVRPPKPGEERVVFLGGQITERWND